VYRIKEELENMEKGTIYQKLAKICSSKNISKDSEILNEYSEDLSFFEGKVPNFVVWPSNAQQVEKILKLANREGFSIIPVSSSSKVRHHGDTIPHKDNCIILNLSNMKKIISISRKNRVAMIEPGVTYEELIPKLKQEGLRLLLPLHPTGTKSVVTSALEREPIIIPRYHWDSSDPLLCTEVVFGTGDLFRTGTAAGPGTIKEQKKSGQSQVNPMGPTQFSPFRLIQGAQGSLGVITWATLKLELSPTVQKVFHLQSDNLIELLDLQHELIKYRLGDELFLLNNINLASLIKLDSQDIIKLSESLKKWNLIFILAGRGKLANDKIAYQELDFKDILKSLDLAKLNRTSNISEKDIIHAVSQFTSNPWRMRLKGAFQDIIFIINFEKIPQFISIVEEELPYDIGVYIQPINQGTSYHSELDIYYDAKDNLVLEILKAKFLEISTRLMDLGAFFNRPYGVWAKDVYAHHSEETITALKKVKKIFDPNNVLNPGVLCFDD